MRTIRYRRQCRVRSSLWLWPCGTLEALGSIVHGLPSRRWEGDVPETRSRLDEFDRNQIALLIFSRRPRDSASLLLFRAVVDHVEFRIQRKVSRADQHRA